MFKQPHRKFSPGSESALADEAQEDFSVDSDDGSRVEDSEAPEAVESQKELWQSVGTVAELLDSWVEQYQQTNDDAVKSELTYRIFKMRMALSEAKLEADKVGVREYEPDTFGFYIPATGELAMTPEGIESGDFAGILFHESAHAGRNTGGRRIFDEGVAEWVTEHGLPEALKGYYETEQHRAERAFKHVGMGKAAEIYDFDKPTKLVWMYLKVELNDRWSGTLKRRFQKEQPETAKDINEFLEGALDSSHDIERLFKKGVPELYARLRESGFNFRQAGLKILKHLSRQG